jgi:murein DD-endopeptidase MepM/ murein hydrolase activator NlpD
VLWRRAYDRSVNVTVGQWLRHAAGAAVQLCSLRNFVLVSGGALLALSPLASGLSTAASSEHLPYLPSYAHQAYGYSLALTRLRTNAPARSWLAAADRALLEPQSVALPFAGHGEFAASHLAAGYAFQVVAGRRVQVAVAFEPAEGRELFVDLFRLVDGRRERVAGAPPSGHREPFAIDATDAGDYVLRVQPELAAAGTYEVRINATPLLQFPVQGHDARAIWSGFGAERDGGRRAHRGVDIFAARGTPALAATDGWVVRVQTTRVGGNVVWLQPLFSDMRLYYAHLDQQWVKSGDFVLAGQPLGAVGNTGNAIATPPHLHFGVYVRKPGMRGGARDPAGFLR